MTTQLNLSEPKVKIINNHLMVSSLDVAEHFSKRHDNVVRAIKSLDIPKDLRALNFEETSIEVEQPNGGYRKTLAYNMARDGFVLLVMGFTGKEAMQWKIRYIQAFNAMEAELFGKTEQLKLDAPSTKTERKPLANLVNTLVSVAPVSYRDAWHMVHARMGGKHADELTLAEVQTAIEFVQEQINIHTAKAVPFPQLSEYEQTVVDCMRKMSTSLIASTVLLCGAATGQYK